MSSIKKLENIPLRGPKNKKKVIQNTVFANSIQVITTICKVYGTLLTHLLIDIVLALAEIMELVLFVVPLQGLSLT